MTLPRRCAAFLALTLTACSVSMHRPAPSLQETGVPTLQIQADDYDLYTADPEEAADAADQLDYAAERFRELFGTDPRRIAVVLFEHPEHVQDYDFDPIREQGLLGLPWLSDEALIAAARRVMGSMADRGSLPTRALSHEACHMYLIAHVSAELGYDDPNERLAALDESSYGDPRMPDWFDEAVAVLCEPDEMRADRRAAMRGGLEMRTPLADFFALEHPSQHATPAGAPREEERQRRGPRITITRGNAGGPDLFYPQALSVAEFLIDREGPEIIGWLADVFTQGDAMEAMLAEVENLPDDVEALEAEWLRWMEGSP